MSYLTDEYGNPTPKGEFSVFNGTLPTQMIPGSTVPFINLNK